MIFAKVIQITLLVILRQTTKNKEKRAFIFPLPVNTHRRWSALEIR